MNIIWLAVHWSEYCYAKFFQWFWTDKFSQFKEDLDCCVSLSLTPHLLSHCLCSISMYCNLSIFFVPGCLKNCQSKILRILLWIMEMQHNKLVCPFLFLFNLRKQILFSEEPFIFLFQELVKKAVSLAIARDGASGGVVRTVIVRSPFLPFCLLLTTINFLLVKLECCM